MDVILLLGCIQAFFLTALLLSKRGRSLPDSILAVWLGHIGVHLLVYFLARRAIPVSPMILNLNGVLPLLQGPYLFLYVASLVHPDFQFRRWWTIHLLPGLLYIVLVLHLLAAQDHPPDLSAITVIVNGTICLSVPLYVALSLHQIRKHNQHLHSYLSSTGGKDLSWLRTILLGMSVLWVVVIGVNLRQYFHPAHAHGSSHAIFLILTVFIYAIGYLGIRQKRIFTDESDDLPIKPMGHTRGSLAEGSDSNDSPASKYERSGLQQERATEISRKLDELMQSEKPFLGEDLSLQWLADRMEVPANHLSQVINQESGANFYDFVNRYRIEEFLERRRDPSSENLTLLAIALASGFQSKSSFNRTFKRLMGCPPSQFKDLRSQPAR
ncbi:MAG: AraC family transcriptional regulator [Gemmatimonadetes bacterium]|jgi:AraC-like DNA-binding protein|nr:AraC family transcriptional regulator [Gemmatimonadota bacterium]